MFHILMYDSMMTERHSYYLDRDILKRPNKVKRLYNHIFKDKTKKTLVLDLDETLIKTCTNKTDCDKEFDIVVDNEPTHIYVSKRPYLDLFLEKVTDIFHVIVFTAGLPNYANAILDWLGFDGVRLFRDACTLHNGNYVKNLLTLGVDLKNVIIIDNSPLSYQFQVQNALPINSFDGDLSDFELLRILPSLKDLANCNDVRIGLRSYVFQS